MSKLGQLSKSVGVAGCLVTLCDLTQPIAPFATYIAALSLVVLLVLGIIKLFSKSWGENHTIFGYFVLIVFVLSTALTVYQHQTKDAKKKGLIASKLTTVQEIQASLGMVNAQLVEANKSLKSIDKQMENTKKEVSENPRKELANLGIPWNSEHFYKAIVHNDEAIIDLFFQGGMQIDRIATEYAGNSILTHIIYEPKSNWKDVLEKAKDSGFNFNTKIRYNHGSKEGTPVYIAMKQEEYEVAEYILKQGVNTDEVEKVFKTALSKAKKTVNSAKPKECVRDQNDHFNMSYGSCVKRYRNILKNRESAQHSLKKAQKVLGLVNKYK